MLFWARMPEFVQPAKVGTIHVVEIAPVVHPPGALVARNAQSVFAPGTEGHVRVTADQGLTAFPARRKLGFSGAASCSAIRVTKST